MDSIRYIALQLIDFCPKDWRKGQAVFNIVYKLHPEIANKFIGTDIDPFYNDDKIDDFLLAVTKESGEIRK